MRRRLAAVLCIVAMEFTVNAAEPCELIRVDASGALVVRLRDTEQAIAIFGIDVELPPPKEYLEIIAERIPRLSRTLQCTVLAPGLPPRAGSTISPGATRAATCGKTWR